MYLLLRFTPFLLASTGFVFLFFLSRFTELTKQLTMGALLWAFFFYLLILFIGMIFLGAGYPVKTRVRFFPFLLISWIGGYGIFLFNDQPWILSGIMILLPAITWIWLESLYLFWQRSFAYQAYTLQRIARYLYILAAFLFATTMIGVEVLLQIPAWLLFLAALPVAIWLQYDYFLLQRLSSRESFVFAGIGSILLLQLMIALHLLPTHFFLYGLITMLFFYLWLGIMTQALQKKQHEELVWLPYLLISSLGAGAGIFTSLFI